MPLKSMFTKATAAAFAAVFAIVLATFSSFAASEFEGTWKAKDKSGKPLEITLAADGSAKVNDGPDGTWKEVAGSAVIQWESGWTNKITKEGSTYKLEGYKKGASLDEPPTLTVDTEKAR